MAKTKAQYVCSACGGVQMKWMGKCPECGEWNTLEEVVVRAPEKNRSPMPLGVTGTRPVALPDIPKESMDRMPLKMAELNRVLGGGIVPGGCVLVGGDPGIGKCVVGDTRLLDPISGAFLPITEWAKQRRQVVSLDPKTHRLSAQTVSAFLAQGVKPIVQIKTRLGRTLRCTPSHPVLTPTGWQAVGELSPGARIAAPRALPYFGNERMSEHEVKLIAYVLSDGSATSAIDVTSATPEIESDLHEVAHAFGLQLRIYQKPNNRAKQFRFVQPLGQRAEARKEIATALKNVQATSGLTWAAWARLAEVSYALLNVWRRGEAAPGLDELERLAQAAHVPLETLAPTARDQAEMTTSVARLLDAVGLRYIKAHNKFVPECIFRLPREQLALFLKVLFSCDGSVYVLQQKSAGISYSTISERLAQDVQHLLLRFGFVTKLRTKPSQVNGQPYTAYELQLLGIAEVKRFLAEIGIWGRDAAQAQIRALPFPRLSSTHIDTIPTGVTFWERLREATTGVSFKIISANAGVTLRNRRHERPLTRTTVAALANAYPSPYLNLVAHSDVYWDEIQSIIPAGEEQVYDLTVPTHANFVANDLIVHNSTLLLHMAAEIAQTTGPVLYVSAEESVHQIGRRATRLGIQDERLFILSEIEVEQILEQIENMKPTLVIVDSIQAIYSGSSTSAAGTVSQVRDSAAALLRMGKQFNIPIFLVGHVTKEGTIAGPRVLEHMVDVVLQLEGERFHAFRLLRSVKNRFGSTNEVGIFEMNEGGMTEVRNPSELFLAERLPNASGSAIAISMEGTRPLLVEVQALSSHSAFSQPRRTGNGIDMNRLLLLTAVLSKRVGMDLSDQDVFVNIVGGMRIDEPAADLAIAAAIASSYRNKPVCADLAIVGEVGLSGELRSVGQLPRRLHEAAKLGFARALTPRSVVARKGVDALPKEIEVIGVRTLWDALDVALIK